MIIEKNRTYKLKHNGGLQLGHNKFTSDKVYVVCAVSYYDVYFYHSNNPIGITYFETYFQLTQLEQRKDKLKKLKCLK